MSRKYEAMEELGYLAKYGKFKEGKVANRVSNLKCSNFVPRTSRYGSTLLTRP
jgi:hypothetical protein